jgi:hypothetical protein
VTRLSHPTGDEDDNDSFDEVLAEGSETTVEL